MNNNKELKNELLKQDGIDPAKVSDTERLRFKALLAREQKHVDRMKWIVQIPFWIFVAVMFVLVASESVLEELSIPFDVAGITVALVVLVILLPMSIHLLFRFKERKAKLKRIWALIPEYTDEYEGGIIIVCKKDGKRTIRWPLLITLAITLALFSAIVSGGIFYLLSQYWSGSAMIYGGLIGIGFVAFGVYFGLRTPIEELRNIPKQRTNILQAFLKSRITKFAVVTVMMILFLFSIYIAQYDPDPQDTVILGQASLYSESYATMRVLVRNHATNRPIKNATVRLTIQGNNIKEDLGKFVTGEDGCISEAVFIPSIPPGRYNLVVKSKSRVGKDRIDRTLEIKRPYRLYITTDKPIYQPGQTLHMRAIVLNRVSLKPFANQSILFEIEDSKGNKVFRTKCTTSDYGIGSADFDIAKEVNLGRYRIRAIAGDVESEKIVTVKHYVLPKFKVEVSTNRSYYLPFEEITGTVKASYFFGKPVTNAQVEIVGRTIIEKPTEIFKITGLTNDRGEFVFHTKLTGYFTGMPLAGGNAFLQFETTVTDTAGHEETISEHRVIAQQRINVHVFPESGELVQGIENLIYIMTAYPDGRPAVCQIDVDGSVLTTDESGVAVIKMIPKDNTATLKIKATDEAGNMVIVVREIRSSDSFQDFLLRTDKAVYLGGETINITILSAIQRSTFFLDVIKDGQTMLTKTLSIKEEQETLAIDLPPGVFGTLKLNAYTITAEGQSVADSRIVYVHQPSQLKIETISDKIVYRPGETAKMDFRVTDTQGIPTPAALSLSIVDEAVFYLTENRPGLLEQFFLADEELLKPAYQIKFAISPAKLFSGEDKYQKLATALFSHSTQAPEATLTLNDFIDYLPPSTLERIRENLEQGHYNELLRDPQYAELREQLMPQQDDYTLRATTYDEKIAQAKAFRKRYFEIIMIAFVILLVAGFALCLLRGLFSSVFGLIRPVGIKGLDANRMAALKTANRLVNSYALLFLFPITTYLFAGLLCVFAGLLYVFFDYDFYIDPGQVFLSTFVINALLAAVLTVQQLRWSLALARFPETSGIVGKMLNLTGIFIIQYIATRMIIIGCVFELFEGRFAFLAGLASLISTMAIYFYAANILSGNVALRYHVVLKRPRGVTVAVVIAVLILLYPLFMPALCKVGPYAPALSYTADLKTTGQASEIHKAEHPEIGEPREQESAPRLRRYFPETLLWQPEMITDDKGKATLDITTADSITTWRMNVDAVSAAGKLGNSEVGIRVFQDFFVDLDLPVALTRNDEISIPVLCYNYLQQPQTVQLNIQAEPWCDLQGPLTQEVRLAPNEVKSAMFWMKAKEVGSHELTLIAQGDKASDAVQRHIDVRPDGSEVINLQCGVLTVSADHTFYIPPQAIPNSQSLILKLYPSTFSEVVEGLENIFRMPFGCFEQTSSVTYPNVMALQYMKRTNQVTPEIEIKARKFITAGYQRLLTFEVDGGGFDWFGHPPANEILTAYGILEFTDMAKVHNVDQAVIDRAIQWLMSKQTSDGSWSSSNRTETLHSVQGKLLNTAYITWALTEAGQRGKEMDAALTYLRQHMDSTEQTYTIVLAANAFLSRNARDAFGKELLARLRPHFRIEDDSAYISSPGTGAIYSRGHCLDVETTALATLAMMKANRYPDIVKKALTWISQQKDQFGTWHSTQATILAMKALIAGTGQALSSDIPSKIDVVVNGKTTGQTAITPDTSDLVHMVVLTNQLQVGENTIRITQDERIRIPYRLVGTYWVPTKAPAITTEKELEILIEYDKARLEVDDILTCNVQVKRNGKMPVNMAIIDLGIPPGFKVDTSAFQRLVESGKLAKYELTGNQCILYVRRIEPTQPLRFRYELKALYPIRAKIPPSRVYEYYKPENEDRSLPTQIEVKKQII